MICRRALRDRIDAVDAEERIEKADAADPIEKADAADPIEPTERIDPIEPTERNEPLEPIERTESCDHRDHFEPAAAATTRRSYVSRSRRWHLGCSATPASSGLPA